MVDVIRDARILPGAQVRFRERYTSLMGEAVSQIAGLLSLRGAGEGGVIPRRDLDLVVGRAGEIVQGVFVVDGRRSLDPDGVPLSRYAQALMSEIYLVTAGVVNRHADYMARHLDQQTLGVLAREGRTIREQEEQIGRLFDPNPLAFYEPAHTWVDPNGYTLSQRIWNNSVVTRQKLDAFMAQMIAEGRGSQYIAQRVEQFLLPGRAKIRTSRPYGRYGTDASYDAMRLARTEIARAHNQASWVSAYLNPYVDQIRLMRSPNGDPTCPICLEHAGPVGGEGIVYPVTSAPIPPFHPHDMCRVDSEVTIPPGEVTAELRGRLAVARDDLLLTPVQRRAFIDLLMGEAVARMVRQLVQFPLGL